MQIKLIRNETEYSEALEELDRLMDLDPPSGSEEAEKLELLAVLIERYEQEHYPLDMPDPVDAIRFVMEQRGLRQKDLVPYIGSPSRVSEVLARKRPLTLSMIRRLHEGLGIPVNILVGRLEAFSIE